MRSSFLFQCFLLATAILSASARRGMDYKPNDTEIVPQRLRQSNNASGKPRHHTYMRRAAERKHSSKATSEIVSMSMTTEDGYGDSSTTPAPAVFEETPAPTVTDDIGPVAVSEETGEIEENFGPIGVSVDVGGDNNIVTASIQIVQGGGSINVSSEDTESDDDEEEGDDEEESVDDDDTQLDDVIIYDDYPVDDGWDDHDDSYGSISMSMTTDDSTYDGYGATASDDYGPTDVEDDTPATDDGYGSNTVEVETDVVADDNLGGDDQYAKFTQDDDGTAEYTSAEDSSSITVDSTDDGYIDDNFKYFDDDFVVDLPSEEDLKVI